MRGAPVVDVLLLLSVLGVVLVEVEHDGRGARLEEHEDGAQAPGRRDQHRGRRHQLQLQGNCSTSASSAAGRLQMQSSCLQDGMQRGGMGPGAGLHGAWVKGTCMLPASVEVHFSKGCAS